MPVRCKVERVKLTACRHRTSTNRTNLRLDHRRSRAQKEKIISAPLLGTVKMTDYVLCVHESKLDGVYSGLISNRTVDSRPSVLQEPATALIFFDIVLYEPTLMFVGRMQEELRSGFFL